MTRRIAFALGFAATLALSGCGDTADTQAARPALDQADGASTAFVDDRSTPPWPAPTDVAERVASAGLDLGPMGTAEHYHPSLRIVIGGADVAVPANIGVDPASGAMSALHTHETDGTIHVEADLIGEAFTLGQFFAEWGVMLTPTQIGGVSAEPGQRVEVSSNGTVVVGDPADLQLESDQQIVVSLG